LPACLQHKEVLESSLAQLKGDNERNIGDVRRIRQREVLLKEVRRAELAPPLSAAAAAAACLWGLIYCLPCSIVAWLRAPASGCCNEVCQCVAGTASASRPLSSMFLQLLAAFPCFLCLNCASRWM
jgi:hypothetical protein